MGRGVGADRQVTPGRAGIAVAVLLLLAACGPPPPREARAPALRDAEAARILREIGLPRPASARVTYAEYMSGIDAAGRLALVMSAADWDRWRMRIARGSPRALLFSRNAEETFMLAPDDDPGWRPQDAAGLRVASTNWADETQGLNVGVAPAGAGRVRVFLFWHET